MVNFDAAPVAGTFQPTGPGSLVDFVSENALGTWTLNIEDTAGADALRFRRFDLTIVTDGDGGGAVPEPTSLALMGSGLLALGLTRYRRSRR